MAVQRVAILAATWLLCLLLQCQVQAQSCGGFLASCPGEWYFYKESGVFEMQCKNNDGQINNASINLNDHLGNDNGRLVQGSGFLNSCTEEYWHWSRPNNVFEIVAKCLKQQGADNWQITNFDIEKHVANYNGNLVFNSCRRRRALLSTPALGSRKVLSA